MSLITALRRHPVKGFTPEHVVEALLTQDAFFPFDRLFALEVGDSGFDAAHPRTISKMRFTVLARFAAIARLRTRCDEISGVFYVGNDDDGERAFDLTNEAGRNALARHIETVLGRHEPDYDPVRFPLRLLTAPGFDEVKSHFRFTDSSKGFVSVLNLNSLRELGSHMGMELDPLRLRCNLWVEGLEPFVDHGWAGQRLMIGRDGVELEVLKPIERCIATHVNPATAEIDADVCRGLWDNYRHRNCGIYARIVSGGLVYPGDQIRLA